MEEVKILLVENESDVAENISDRLRKKGFTISYVLSSKEAFDKLEDFECNIVVFNLKMPGLNWKAFLNRIKEKRPKAKVICIADFSSMSIAVQAKSMGVFDYLLKPIDTDRMIQVIQAAIQKPKTV